MPTSQPSNPAASAAAPGGASRLILFATVFFDLLGFGIVIPFLPMYAARLGVGAGAIGLLLSAYSMMQFIFAPLLGRLSDRIGRRPIIMLGLLGSSLSYLIYGFTDSFAGLLITRAAPALEDRAHAKVYARAHDPRSICRASSGVIARSHPCSWWPS
jgi:MFS family permease